MSNVEVGSAYVSVYPKADKNFNNSVGQDIGNSIGTGLSAKAVAIGNIVSSAVLSAANAAANGISSVIGGAFENYANYEQLVGGIDTLFKESSGAVQRNAQEAFKSVGMSANEYMENVTSFSASLLAGLGGDTEKAAAYADMAMRDMSDNANKMGSDMEAITNAYQGFAKQNYTMLDNLKLGYGGTKGEMERLLKDASAIAGVEFNIDNYNDVIEAIHIMQEQMGIAGTTAKEAEGTISGSIAMLKASWQNFLTELGKDDADLQTRAGELVDSIVTTAGNIAPRLLAIAQNIFAAIPELYEKLKPYIDEFIAMAGQFIEEHQPEIQAASEKLFDGVMAAFGNMAKLGVQALIKFIGELIKTMPEWYPQLQQAAFQLFLQVVSGFANGLTPFMNQVNSLIDSGLKGIGSFFGDFFLAGKDIIDNIAQGIGSVASGIKDALEDPLGAAQRFIEDVMGTIERIVSGVKLELPHIPLPDFHVEGGEFPYGIGGYGSMPYFWVEWKGKGGFADQPTLTGYGEKGLELYWPSYDPYFDMYAKGIAEHMPKGAGGVDIHDCTFVIREENDIRRVADELNRLIDRQNAGALA